MVEDDMLDQIYKIEMYSDFNFQDFIFGSNMTTHLGTALQTILLYTHLIFKYLL